MKCLIANRGEIAVRIARTLKDMGISPIGVYSDPDKFSLHNFFMDASYPLGGRSSYETYLNIDKILWVLEKEKVDFLHPGYGFLSENSKFAEEVIKRDVNFVGPSPEAMELMGDKVLARKIAEKCYVPVVPGYSEKLSSPNEAIKIAEKLGFPLMLKASMGGGGKGMRIVRNKQEFISLFNLAFKEAESAFADGSLYIERFIEKPKHIEVQIIGDKYGNYYALGERECSIQRRHQKLIEESPSYFIDEKTRENIQEAAIEIAKSVKYYNAGTVEFIFDENKNFYFIEMNTRLQVEHPVTEMRSSLDLVMLQLKVAMGEKLKLEKPYPLKGYSLEVRVYAEDPYENFMPSPGEIKWLHYPQGPFVRVDSGVYQGFYVPEEYDPLLMKIITWGADKKEGTLRMIRALGELFIAGIKTTKEFSLQLISSDFFERGEYDTFLLEKWKPEISEFVFIEEDLLSFADKKGVIEEKKEIIKSRWKDFSFFFNKFEL
ncbi:MAG: biotin carboxylase N-terminal domain-containing protein [Candidatus Hydrothermales bacterium]